MAHFDWIPSKLDQLGFVGRGKSRHRPRDDAQLYGGPYPFFQTGDVKAANLVLTQHTQTYSEFGVSQSKVWEPGTLCITIAANIAETAILGVRGCFPDSVVGFVPDPCKADVRFVKYYIDTIKLQMQSVSRGTTQDNLSVEKLLSFDLLMPSLHEQHRISSILSAYDDLIENCQRRIRILEDMARGLYREWFVNFRFPGADVVPLIDSPLGHIPTGWSCGLVSDIATVLRGKSYRSVDLADEGGVPFVTLKCLDRDGGFRRSGLKRYVGEFKPAHTVGFGSIVMAVTDMTQERRIIARAAWVPTLDADFGVLSMDLVRIDSNGVEAEYLYAFLRFSSFPDIVKQYANGANVLHLSPDRISEFRLPIPDARLIQQFAAIYRPMLASVDGLENRIDNLRRTRDLLLPRLLSGQIRVEAATEHLQDDQQPLPATSPLTVPA